MSTSTNRHKPSEHDESALTLRIEEITNTHVRYGDCRVCMFLLHRQHRRDNVARLYRLYGEETCRRLKRSRRNKSVTRCAARHRTGSGRASIRGRAPAPLTPSTPSPMASMRASGREPKFEIPYKFRTIKKYATPLLSG